MKILVLVALFSLASCASTPAPVVPIEIAPAAAYAGPDVALQPDRQRSAADEQALSALIAETLRIVQSPAFDQHLRAVDSALGPIQQWPTGTRLTAATVADLYAGRDSRYTFRRALVTWRRSGTTSTTGSSGSVVLAGSVRNHWRLNSIEGRSLAINSLAHELSHTLSSEPDGGIRFVFSDKNFSGGRSQGWPPVASYTIGSVAQCTYLEEQHGLVGTFTDCLRRYGVGRFTP